MDPRRGGAGRLLSAPAKDPDRFFLATQLPGDDLRFRAPPRRGAEVTPLIDAKKAFAAMEEAILGARSTVHLCWWEFDPATPLVSAAARRAADGPAWADLLEAKAVGSEKVPPAHVRMIVADCDPAFFNPMHEKAWSALEAMQTRRSVLPADAQSRLEVIVGIHPALVAGFADPDDFKAKLLEAAFGTALALVRDQLNASIAGAGADPAALDAAVDDARARFANMPGLWSNLRFDATLRSFALADPLTPTLRPATQHHKLCVVDGETAFCGGLDIAPQRLDDSRHRAAAPWHDIQCQVKGAPVFDIERNFFARWNSELPRFREFVATANTVQPPLRIDVPALAAMSAQAGADAFDQRPGTSRVQVIRTLAEGVATDALLPTTTRRDIEESYLNAIANAEQFVYIENQYVRWLPLADAIVARHRQQPIRVILVVPTLPEEVRNKRDKLVEHGLFLQNEFLQRLAAGLGADFGVFALVQRRPAAAPDPLDLFGSAQVYVHSKIMIVDDVFATVGSANTNGRGFYVDGELNIAWTDPSAVRGFRLKLWSEQLGRPRDLLSWKPPQFVAKWRAIATANSARPPPARQGFVVPVDLASIDPGDAFFPPLPDVDKAC